MFASFVFEKLLVLIVLFAFRKPRHMPDPSVLDWPFVMPVSGEASQASVIFVQLCMTGSSATWEPEMLHV